ncbi:MAG: polysaccharide biosynthesis C-terminal domain-containing protein [Oscillospiraceae bacterium]|nr:polysaccharide biosynthesis C-terminal domain-containing protein [Oscillospiraceae bacterium]
MPRKLPIFYSALLLTGVNLLLRFVSTSFQVYISGKIGAAGVGLLQLVLSVGAMAMTLGVAGIRTTTMYLSAEELGKKRPENVRPILSGCFIYSIVCSGFVALGLYFGAPFLAENWIGDSGTIWAIRVYAAFLPVSCLCGVMTGYFTAANRIGTLAAVEVAEQLLSMVCTMLLLIFWAGQSPARACQAIILGNGISMCMTLMCLVVLRARERPPTGPQIPVRQRLLSAAVPLALADDLKAGISTTENLMVPKRLALYSGVDDPLAAFGTVCGMVFPVLMFPAAILYGLAELLIPELARCAAAGSRQRIQYLSKQSLRVALIYGCFFGAMEFLLAKELCEKLYGDPDIGTVLRLYALLIPMLYCDAITDAMIKGLGQQKASVRYNIMTSSMDVLFLFLLLPRYGMHGYFFSFLVTHLINFGLSIRRLLKIVGNVISLKTPLLALGGAAAAVWIVMGLPSPILRCGAFLIVFICLLFLLQVLQKEDLSWLKGLVIKK